MQTEQFEVVDILHHQPVDKDGSVECQETIPEQGRGSIQSNGYQATMAGCEHHHRQNLVHLHWMILMPCKSIVNRQKSSANSHSPIFCLLSPMVAKIRSAFIRVRFWKMDGPDSVYGQVLKSGAPLM